MNEALLFAAPGPSVKVLWVCVCLRAMASLSKIAYVFVDRTFLCPGLRTARTDTNCTMFVAHESSDCGHFRDFDHRLQILRA